MLSDWDNFKSIFPSKFSSFMDNPIIDRWVEEAKEWCLMDDKEYNICRETWKLALVFHPFCKDQKRMEVIVKLNILLFVWDDHSECKWGDAKQQVEKVNEQWSQLKAMFDRLMGADISMVSWKPYIVLGYLVFEDIFKDISETGRKRMAKHMKLSADAYIKENLKLRADGNLKFNSVEEMLKFKQGVQIAWITPMCFEYTDGITVSEEEWDEPHFQECLELYYKCLDMSQDLGSFQKELIQEDGKLDMINNVVALIVLLDKCSHEEAMNKATKYYFDLERKAKSTWNKYSLDGTFSSNQIAMFDKIEYILGGHVWLVKTINRYNDMSIYDGVQ